MGIKRLNNFLNNYDALKYHNNIGDYIRSFKNDGYKCFNTRKNPFIIGIDLMLYAHKYEYSCGSIYPGFINQILNFMSNQIIPVYIIDGTAPIEKNDIINSRNLKKDKILLKINKLEDSLNEPLLNEDEKNKILNQIKKLNKSNINITSTHIYNLTQLFDIFNVPYIRASGEADTLIAALYKKNVIDACLSEDMDLLVYGCDKMIKFKSNNIIEYDLEYILEKINLSKNEFIELCILFGCDYLKPLLRDKPDVIYNNYNNSNNLKDMFKDYTNQSTVDKYIEEFFNTKNLFLKSANEENFGYVNIKPKYIEINKLYDFINNNCDFFQSANLKYQISHINFLIKTNKMQN